MGASECLTNDMKFCNATRLIIETQPQAQVLKFTIEKMPWFSTASFLHVNILLEEAPKEP